MCSGKLFILESIQLEHVLSWLMDLVRHIIYHKTSPFEMRLGGRNGKFEKKKNWAVKLREIGRSRFCPIDDNSIYIYTLKFCEYFRQSNHKYSKIISLLHIQMELKVLSNSILCLIIALVLV